MDNVAPLQLVKAPAHDGIGRIPQDQLLSHKEDRLALLTSSLNRLNRMLKAVPENDFQAQVDLAVPISLIMAEMADATRWINSMRGAK